MPTPAKVRMLKSIKARLAKGERRLGGFIDAETAEMLDDYVKRSGLEKQEVMRIAIRRLVNEEQETTAA
jgi:hypothetical protein